MWEVIVLLVDIVVIDGIVDHHWLNKHYRKSKEQSWMDNAETLSNIEYTRTLLTKYKTQYMLDTTMRKHK